MTSLVLLVVLTEPTPARDTVLDWNEIALATTAAAPFDPPLESRSLAIVHAAMFDAVNAVAGTFRRYLTTAKAEPGASAPVAAAAAAHRALIRLYPGQRAALDAAYSKSLAALPAGGRAAGVALGEKVADEVLAARAGDGAERARVAALPTAKAGIWVPTPPAFLPALDPGWGAVRPFVLERGSQLRPGPPPVLESEEYRRDLTEIREVGAARSTTRTQAQTDVARLWIATGPQNWNPLARQVARARRLTLLENARAFALLNLAGADAFIAAWDAKYTWNQWRPVTALRAGGERDWTPLVTTPPFPDYIAGHTTYAGAAERVLERVFGKPGLILQLRSATAPGVVRTYDTFAAVSADVVEARVWGGIHWRTSCVRGRAVGQQVGDYAFEHALLPGPNAVSGGERSRRPARR